MAPQWRNKMIFIAGHHDTGKSTSAIFLVENQFLHIETSDIVRRSYSESNSILTMGDWAKSQNHNFDDLIIRTVKSTKEEAIISGRPDVVVTGNRQIEGIDKIRKSIEPLVGTKHIIIYTEADPEILFTRHQNRQDRKVPNLTLDKFKLEILGYDQEMGVEKIKDYADIVIRNNCSKETLRINLISEIKKLGYCFSTPEEGLNKGQERI